jgi:hypothetical protein
MNLKPSSFFVVFGAILGFSLPVKSLPGDSISELQQKLSLSQIFQGEELTYDLTYGGGYHTNFINYDGGPFISLLVTKMAELQMKEFSFGVLGIVISLSAKINFLHHSSDMG